MALCSFYKVAREDYARTIGVPNEFSRIGHNFWYAFFNTNLAAYWVMLPGVAPGVIRVSRLEGVI
jgi:hypothetical protein